MTRFITAQGLKELREYKYKPTHYTPLDNLLNPYWLWVTSLMPHWLAPNLITFIGLMALLLARAVNLFFDPSLTQDIPNWCFLLFAFANLTYSTLDAVDGKQARRTGSSSPLGHLFDHSCDSITIVVIMLSMGHAGKLNTAVTTLMILCSELIFWTAVWKEHRTGVLITGIGSIGVNEGIYVACLLDVITFFKGQSYWNTTLIEVLPQGASSVLTQWVSLELSLGHLIGLSFSSFTLIPSLFFIIQGLVKDIRSFNEHIGCILLIGLQTLWYRLDIYDSYQGIILCIFAMEVSLVISKTIVCSVAKMPIPKYHREVIPSIVVTVVMLCLELASLCSAQIYTMWVYGAISLPMVTLSFRKIISQITSSLEISCFKIQKGPKKPDDIYDQQLTSPLFNAYDFIQL